MITGRDSFLLFVKTVVLCGGGFLSFLNASTAENAFMPGFKYRYAYEGQILTSGDSQSGQASGLKIKSDCVLEFQFNNLVVLWLDNIELYKLNGKVDFNIWDEMIPESEPVLGEQFESFSEELLKPIAFRYVSGVITEVKHKLDDPYWSVNIKKGVASLFMVKLREAKLSSGGRLFRSARYGFSPVLMSFTRQEADSSGHCDTKYIVSSEEEEANKLHLIKVKDFANCLGSDEYIQGLFGAFSRTNKKLIERMSHTSYVLTGSRDRFRVDDVYLKSHYIIDMNENKPTSRVTMKLALKESGALSYALNIDQSFKLDLNGLRLNLPKSNPLIRSDLNHETHSDYAEIIESKLDRLMEAIYPDVDENVLRKVLELHHLLRHVDPDQLTSIILSYSHNLTDRFAAKKWKLLLDVLPTLTSCDVSKIVVNLIKSGKLDDSAARAILTKMASIVKPSPEVIDTLMSLWREMPASTLRYSVLNAVSITTNRLHLMMPRPPRHEILFALESIAQELTSLLEATRPEVEKMEILTAMSNLGANSLVPTLKKLYDDKTQSVRLRIKAIQATRKIAQTNSNMVHMLMLPLYLDILENISIRRAALQVVMTTGPSYQSLQLIGQSLTNEPIRGLKTLAYSYLINLVDYKGTHFPGLSENARMVLSIIPPLDLSYTDDRQFQYAYPLTKLNVKGFLNIEFGKDDELGYPNYFKVSLASEMFGFHAPLLDLEFSLDEEVDSFDQLNQTMNILARILKDKDETFSNKLNQAMHALKSFQNSLRLNLNGQILNQDTWKESIRLSGSYEKVVDALRELTQKASDSLSLDSLHTLSLASNSFMFPSSLGVPISVNISLISIARLQGVIQATNVPPVYQLLQDGPMHTVESTVLRINVQPRVSTLIIGHLGADFRWFCTGAGFKTTLDLNMPLNMSASIKSGINVSITKENLPGVRIKHIPFTYIHYIPRSIKHLPYRFDVKPMLNREAKKMHWSRDAMGVALKVNQTEGMALIGQLEPTDGAKINVYIDIIPDPQKTNEIISQHQSGTLNNFWSTSTLQEGSNMAESYGGYLVKFGTRTGGDDNLRFLLLSQIDQDNIYNIKFIDLLNAEVQMKINPNIIAGRSEDAKMPILSFNVSLLNENIKDTSEEVSKLQLAADLIKKEIESASNTVGKSFIKMFSNIIDQIRDVVQSESTHIGKVGAEVSYFPESDKLGLKLKHLKDTAYVSLDAVPHWLKGLLRHLPSSPNCPHECDATPDYVCGTDNVTYPSLCHLRRSVCVTGQRIDIKHFGICL